MARPLPEEYAEIELLYRTAPAALGLIDRDFRFVRLNERMAAINGAGVAAHIGRTIREIIPDLAPALEEIYARVLTTGEPIVDLLVHGTTPAEPGVERDWLASYYPVFDADGTVGKVSTVVIDVTERRRAEEALQATHTRLQRILDSMYAFVAVMSIDGIVRAVNRAPLEAAGLSAEDVIGHPFDSLAPWSYSPEVRERLRAALRSAADGHVVRYDEEILMGGEQRIWVDALFGPLRDSGGQVTEIVASGIDVTDRRRATDALMQVSERLHHLSRRLLEVQETERRALAHELHDEIGQALTATRINLQAIERFPDEATMAPRLGDAIAIVDRALVQVRSMSLGLRPPMLDDIGLPAALRWLVGEQSRPSAVRVSYAGDADIERLDPAIEIACFRVAQEALNNVIRHAGATTATVELRRIGDALHVRIQDNGVGFDVAAARARASSGTSLGLLGMEERTTLAGGGIEWIASPGAGTHVHAWFPLTPRQAP